MARRAAIGLPHCTVDLDRRLVHTRHGTTAARLTALEAALLAFLVDHAGTAVSRERLLAEVWGYAGDVLSRATDNTVRRLRLKIEPDPADPRFLLTVHGTGYRWVSGPAPDRPAVDAPPGAPLLRLGDRVLDLDRHVLLDRGEPDVHLTSGQVALLRRLVQAGGRVVDRRSLLRCMGPGSARRLDKAIHRLRAKIEPDPANPRYLRTHRGTGYRLVLEAEPTASAPRSLSASCRDQVPTRGRGPEPERRRRDRLIDRQ